MQALTHNKAQEQPGHGQRRRFDSVSNIPTSCIPMQIASMQAGQGNPSQKTNTSSLRSDCWNSPLCPRNMPSNSPTGGQPSCGGSSTKTSQPEQRINSASSSPTTEVHIQSSATTDASDSIEQGRPSIKRARTTTSMTSDIKTDISTESSPLLSPQASATTPTTALAAATTAGKEKRLPHHVIERRYRENLNSQIESLRAAVPSTSACLNLDMEDIGNANAASSSIRPLSKAAVIAHAAEYMRQLAAQNEEVERMNRELRVTVEALRRLVNCEDCGVVQQIVDAGS